MANEDVLIRIGAQTSGLDSALASAKSSVGNFASDLKGTLGNLSGAFSGVQGAIAGIGSALGAGAIGGALAGIVAGIEKMSARAVDMRTMADTIGVSVEQFQAMSATADEAGVSMNVFARATEKLTVLLDDARDHSGTAIGKLRDMGVTLEQINDPAFTINDLLGVLKGRLTNASTAQNEHNILLKEFGGRLAEAITLIQAYDGSLAGVAKKDAEVNALSDAQSKRLAEMSAWWKTLGTEIANATSKYLIFLAAKPTDSGLGKAGLLGSPTQAGDLAGNQQGAGQADGQKALADAAKQTQEVVVSASRVTTEAQLKDLHELVAETQTGTAARVAAAQTYYTQSLQFLGKDADTTKAAHAALLADEREYQAKRIELENQSTSAIKASTAAAMAATTRAIEEAKGSLDTMTADAKGDYKAQEEAAVGGINRQIEALHLAASEHRITLAEERSDTQALLAQEWADQQAYYAKLRGLEEAAGASTKTVDAAEEAEHQKFLKGLQDADNKYFGTSASDWKKFGDQIASGLDGVLNNMLTHQKSFAQSMKSLFASMAESIIGSLIRVAIEAVINSLIAKEANVAAAKSSVLANAASAASAAMASAAQIPYVGWILAPAAGAAVYAAALAFPIGAQEGFDVPSGVNPLTQLHSQEMVLPANLANAVRSMAAGGGAGGGGDTHNWNLNMPSHDPKGMEQFLKSAYGRRLLTDAIGGAYRRGVKGTRR